MNNPNIPFVSADPRPTVPGITGGNPKPPETPYVWQLVRVPATNSQDEEKAIPIVPVVISMLGYARDQIAFTTHAETKNLLNLCMQMLHDA